MMINTCMEKKDYPKTRKEAREAGSQFYYTGKPCKYNHDSLRRVTGHCVECGREQSRKLTGPNAYHSTEAWKEYQRNYQSKYRYDPKNRERLRENQLRYYIKKHWNGDREAYEQAKAKREAKKASKTSR